MGNDTKPQQSVSDSAIRSRRYYQRHREKIKARARAYYWRTVDERRAHRRRRWDAERAARHAAELQDAATSLSRRLRYRVLRRLCPPGYKLCVWQEHYVEQSNGYSARYCRACKKQYDRMARYTCRLRSVAT